MKSRLAVQGLENVARVRGDNSAMESFFALLQKNVLDLRWDHPRAAPDRDHDMDRTDLPPSETPTPTGPFGAHRV